MDSLYRLFLSDKSNSATVFIMCMQLCIASTYSLFPNQNIISLLCTCNFQLHMLQLKAVKDANYISSIFIEQLSMHIHKLTKFRTDMRVCSFMCGTSCHILFFIQNKDNIVYLHHDVFLGAKYGHHI